MFLVQALSIDGGGRHALIGKQPTGQAIAGGVAELASAHLRRKLTDSPRGRGLNKWRPGLPGRFHFAGGRREHSLPAISSRCLGSMVAMRATGDTFDPHTTALQNRRAPFS